MNLTKEEWVLLNDSILQIEAQVKQVSYSDVYEDTKESIEDIKILVKKGLSDEYATVVR
jgi:hypothetical protein